MVKKKTKPTELSRQREHVIAVVRMATGLAPVRVRVAQVLTDLIVNVLMMGTFFLANALLFIYVKLCIIILADK